MQSSYDPKSFESRIYEWWKTSGFFRAEDESTKPAFSIMMPPPNVTGVLHNGHALFVTIQDALTRWKRMQGYNALWLPGIDHAGISTQLMVERDLAKEGKTKHGLGREKFLERVWAWKEKHGSIIHQQMQKLGASADWDRNRFTLDPELSKAVREVFVRLYDEGLLYRGKRIINWCLRCQTALSDLEVVPKERTTNLWHIRYKLDAGFITIATTRPETLLGDSAVAVHPEDERFKKWVGKMVELPLVGRKIPIIADAHVDREFGSGALKVTPGHDFNDYEIGLRHQLAIINLLGKDGKLTAEAGPYAGLKISEARDKVVADLNTQKFIVKVEDLTHQAGVCERCSTLVEPIVSEQWFLNVKSMAKAATDAVRRGEKLSLDEVDNHDDAIKILPHGWTHTFYQWMDNIRDWCVSRQLWWGHQIPAWFCGDCKEITVSRSDASVCKHCGSSNIKQDEDVLDTWFSSGLWPFSTLGWPEKTKALQTFYPSSIMETGFDILFFWVARMTMMGIHFMDGKVPFHRVYLHAMVRDEKGQKMSKTKGNVIDPLDIIEEYGADAFRFTLASMSGQGRDVKLSLDRIDGYKAFCNKLWNASRYVLMRSTKLDRTLLEKPEALHPINYWILIRLSKTIGNVNLALEEFRLNDAAHEIYQFIWHEYCDWYIEFSKALMDTHAQETQSCLVHVLEEALKLAHPFIPFVTEEIFQNLQNLGGEKSKRVLMFEKFPKVDPTLAGEASALEKIALWKDAIESLRVFRGENGIAPKARLQARYDLLDLKLRPTFEEGIPLICALSGLQSLDSKKSDGESEVLCKSARFFIQIAGLVDVQAELARLEKERKQVESDIEFVTNKLSKHEFVSKAPAALVEKERQKLAGYEVKLRELIEALERLRKRVG